MANYFNFYTNWQKAKDYDKIEKENKILVRHIEQWREERRIMKEQCHWSIKERYEKLKFEFNENVVTYNGYSTFMKNLKVRIDYARKILKLKDDVSTIDVIESLIDETESTDKKIERIESQLEEAYSEINKVNSQLKEANLNLQKRDPKTGRFVKK